ncbi:MAG: metallophosphoesterase family protein [Pseudomonadota bacterium]
MRTIAHISDLHFGRIDPATLPALADALHAQQPDVVAISGDLTQRARKRQFAEARQFIDTLPGAKIVVPGNHDVPLYNILARWLWPLANYRRFVTPDLEPFFADPEMGVAGVNTARSLTWKSGRINQQQVEASCARFAQLDQSALRVLVTHHPFDATDASHEDDIVGRSRMAMEKFSECKVDLILTGHLHESSARESGYRYEGLGHSTLFIQAGTATSRRTRKSPNTWNLIKLDGTALSVTCWVWDADRRSFAAGRTDSFQRAPGGWQKRKD